MHSYKNMSKVRCSRWDVQITKLYYQIGKMTYLCLEMWLIFKKILQKERSLTVGQKNIS